MYKVTYITFNIWPKQLYDYQNTSRFCFSTNDYFSLCNWLSIHIHYAQWWQFVMWLTCVWVVGGLQGSSCQSGHHGRYQTFACRDLLHDGGGGEGRRGRGHGSVCTQCGATLGQRVGGHGMGPRRNSWYQAGCWRRWLERQPGYEGEERVGGGGHGAVGKSQGHRHVAGQGLGQQAGHTLARAGQRGCRFEAVARWRGGGGDSSGGRGQQVRYSGGLLGRRRGTQAGVLAADGREVHQVIVARFLGLLLWRHVAGREAHDAGGADVPALVFALVGGHLASGGKGEAAARADAVEVVGSFAVHTALVLALLVLVELLEAVFGIGIILDVVALVLLNVTLVLEGECASWAPGTKNEKHMIRYDALPQSLLSTLVRLGGMERVCMIQIVHNGGMITEAVR